MRASRLSFLSFLSWGLLAGGLNGCAIGFTSSVALTADTGGRVGVVGKVGGSFGLGNPDTLLAVIEPRAGVGVDTSGASYGFVELAPSVLKQRGATPYSVGAVLGAQTGLGESGHPVRGRLGLSGFVGRRTLSTGADTSRTDLADLGLAVDAVGVLPCDACERPDGFFQLALGLQYRRLFHFQAGQRATMNPAARAGAR